VGTLALILVPAAVLAGAIALVLSSRDRGRTEPLGPWWGRPGVWVAVSLIWVVVGIVLVPRLLGFTFILLPLFWSRAMGRRRRAERSREE
jgi:hypothetical protein